VQTKSAKAKGRKLQNKVRDDLRRIGKEYGLVDGDIESRQMGGTGVDTVLSPRGKRVFPFDIECKNQESLNVFTEFCKHYQKYRNTKHMKLLVHTKNRSEVLVTMRWSLFLKLFEDRLYCRSDK
jgi:hypothetical protein